MIRNCMTHVYEIQEQPEQIFDEGSQNSGYHLGRVYSLRMDRREPSGILSLLYIFIWPVVVFV